MLLLSICAHGPANSAAPSARRGNERRMVRPPPSEFELGVSLETYGEADGPVVIRTGDALREAAVVASDARRVQVASRRTVI